MWNEALAIIIGYLLGSIPSAYIAGRLVKGVDIRQVGGKNMGTLNTLREIGRTAGFTVLIADIAKGSLAVLVAGWLGVSGIFIMASGFAAIIGHNLPVFLKFRGGKGAATALGVLIAMAPVPAGIALAVIVIIILITSNFTLGLAGGFILTPLLLWLFKNGTDLIYFSLIIAVAMAIRYASTARKALTDPEARRNLLVEKRYKPWQSPRK